MKFIAFFAFVATVTATTVRLSSDENCATFVDIAQTQCGKPFPIINGASYASISDNTNGVDFWEGVGCIGNKQRESTTECFSFKALPFKPQCFKIVCAQVSCLIGVLLFIFILMGLI